MSKEHDELIEYADRWLGNMGCSITLHDPFSAATHNGERPDAIGWRDGISVLIECKCTRSDFFSDAQKPCRRNPETGMGDWRFYLAPKGILTPEDLPEGWGLLEVKRNRVLKTYGFPANTQWWKSPFAGNKRAENQMLVSALRRLKLRGHLEEVYKPYTNEEIDRVYGFDGINQERS